VAPGFDYTLKDSAAPRSSTGSHMATPVQSWAHQSPLGLYSPILPSPAGLGPQQSPFFLPSPSRSPFSHSPTHASPYLTPSTQHCPPPMNLALHAMVLCRNLPDLHRALAGGGWLETGDINGCTPLHVAAALGWADGVAILLEYRMNLHARDVEGQTPLHFAARSGQGSAADALLAAGADPFARSRDGAIPLDMAPADSGSFLALIRWRPPPPPY
jgi:hypothetical protein